MRVGTTVTPHPPDFCFANTAGQMLPQGMLGGDPALTRGQIGDLERAGGVTPFKISADPWTKTLTGRLRLDKDGRVIGSHFEWKQ